MDQIIEKYTRYSVIVIIAIGIGWMMAYPVAPTTALASPKTKVLPDGSTTTPTSSVYPSIESPVRTTVSVQTNNETSITPTVSGSPDTRAPWAWGPRIGGGGGIGIRDVGGYVYISTPGWRCNGALIDPEWVVTNAGCVTENRTTGATIVPSRISVVAGCYSVDNCVTKRNPLWYGTQSQVVSVQQVRVYQPIPMVSDVDMTVALLKLSAPVVTGSGVQILPIGLGSDVVVGQNGLMVMSYGDIPPNKGPTGLQRAAYRIANDSACSAFSVYRDGMHQCGEPVPQVCKNDWGAPVTRIVNGQAVLYGILASQFAVHGTSCPTNARSVAIDVTSSELRSWIATQVKNSRVGVVRNLGGSSGYGTVFMRGNNRQHVVDISSVFPQGIRIGSVTSTKLSINENGVIALGSMTSGIPSYIDLTKWSGGKAPVIVAFGADGDTSGVAQRPTIGGNSAGSNQVWVAQDPTRRVVVITWDDIRPTSTSVTGVRYIGNTYQAELRAQENGDVKVTLRYGVIGWTSGAAQCGATGCTQLAQVGIADGQSRFELGIPVVATSDAELRKLNGTQLTFYLRDGVINKVNQVPTVVPTLTVLRTQSPTKTAVAWTATRTPTTIKKIRIVQMVIGNQVSYLVKQDGSLITWGRYKNIVPTGLTNIRSIAINQMQSYNHDEFGLAVTKQGKLVSWGKTPVGTPKDMTDISQVFAGLNTGYAIKTDGTVVGWGRDRSAVIPSNLGSVKTMCAGAFYALALRHNGTLVGWGESSRYGNLSSYTNIVKITCEFNGWVGLQSNGNVVGYCSVLCAPVPKKLSNVIDISSGAYYSLALKQDGTVVGWGGIHKEGAVVPSSLGAVSAIKAGFHNSSIALKTDGRLVAWGRNENGAFNIPTDNFILVNP